jgi:hypothetical protein
MKVDKNKIRFVMEIPIDEVRDGSQLRMEYSSFDELSSAYNAISRVETSIQTRCSDVSYNYFINYTIRDSENRLVKSKFTLSNSFEFVSDLENQSVFHFFVGDKKYYMLCDNDVRDRYLKLRNSPNNINEIMTILHRSEFVDFRRIFRQFPFEEFLGDVPMEYTLEISVVSNHDNRTCFNFSGFVDSIALPSLYNITVNIQDTNGQFTSTKLVETVYPRSIENPMTVIYFGKTAFVNSEIRNSLDTTILNGTNVYYLFTNSVEELVKFPQYVYYIEFIWKNKKVRYVPYKSLTLLSDSINENYVDNIEHQLRSYFVPPVSPSQVVVEVPVSVEQKYVPEWVSFYHPIVVFDGMRYTIKPTHNHTPAIRSVDRIIFDHVHHMKFPIYWNEQMQCWTTTHTNRDYLERVFGNLIQVATNSVEKNNGEDCIAKRTRRSRGTN